MNNVFKNVITPLAVVAALVFSTSAFAEDKDTTRSFAESTSVTGKMVLKTKPKRELQLQPLSLHQSLNQSLAPQKQPDAAKSSQSLGKLKATSVSSEASKIQSQSK